MHGKGTMTDKSGGVVHGQWENGVRAGANNTDRGKSGDK